MNKTPNAMNSFKRGPQKSFRRAPEACNMAPGAPRDGPKRLPRLDALRAKDMQRPWRLTRVVVVVVVAVGFVAVFAVVVVVVVVVAAAFVIYRNE